MPWTYCPECGCEETRHEEGDHKQCAKCHQEWFADVDYTDVVRQNLAARVADAKRFDFLDKCNRAMNDRYRTHYGWRFDWNHNRVCMLADHNFPALTVRGAIDEAMQKAENPQKIAI